MPICILNVIRIDRAVQLELLASLLVTAGVITGNTSLPVLGRALGDKFEELVKVGAGFRETGQLELFDAAQLVNLSPARLQCQRAVKVGDRLLMLAILGEEASTNVIGLGIRRVQIDRPASENQSIAKTPAALSRLSLV